MGVIKQKFFRGDILGKPRHHYVFLDMEENIHIHYRDLRVELSRGEFEEFAGIFNQLAHELQAVINDRKYQDGQLANANQNEVRLWSNGKLRHAVKYHPRRVSIEECDDGFHLHYRNYKLLIDKLDFAQLVRSINTIDLNRPCASSYDEVLDLIEANEIDFTLDHGNVPGQILALKLAKHHFIKVREIFRLIGFTHEEISPDQHRYTHPALTVLVRPEQNRTVREYRQLRGLDSSVRLTEYLAREYRALGPNEINLIKCQVLDFYWAIRNGRSSLVNIDPYAWLYSPTNQQIVFPYSPTSIASPKTAAESLYKTWTDILDGYQLNSVKPEKDIFPADLQENSRQHIEFRLRQDVASHIAVSKIWLMGSSLRGELGTYQVPFAFGKLAKLGSDIDILVEIDADREDDIPGFWKLHLQNTSNHCPVYHIDQIDLVGDVGREDWEQRYPNIPFHRHLIDAFIYFPSRGQQDSIDEFLNIFKARLIYQRDVDGLFFKGTEERGIAQLMQMFYGLTQPAVERCKTPSQNLIYKVVDSSHDYIFKIFLVAGNYSHKRIAEHVGYESSLVNQLADLGVPTARVILPESAQEIAWDGHPALLFERLSNSTGHGNEYPMANVSAALAQIHQVQGNCALGLKTKFHLADLCAIWLPHFHILRNSGRYDQETGSAFAYLTSHAARFRSEDTREKLFARSLTVHNHGDVAPKNAFLQPDGKAVLFDFNNAFLGPRMADIIDGAYEFSLSESHPGPMNFARFHRFIADYESAFPLNATEKIDLFDWIALIGVIKFTKEIKMHLENSMDGLRRKRALAVAEFLRATPTNSTKAPCGNPAT